MNQQKAQSDDEIETKVIESKTGIALNTQRPTSESVDAPSAGAESV